jgi:hypothetical protein
MGNKEQVWSLRTKTKHFLAYYVKVMYVYVVVEQIIQTIQKNTNMCAPKEQTKSS